MFFLFAVNWTVDVAFCIFRAHIFSFFPRLFRVEVLVSLRFSFFSVFALLADRGSDDTATLLSNPFAPVDCSVTFLVEN